MPASPADLFALLDRLNVPHKTVSHPPLFTVEEARAHRGAVPGGHTKNLFLRDKKGAVYLVVALEDAVIDLKGLHRRLKASGRFSFGSPELMMKLLGVTPGAVTPLAAVNDADGMVRVVIDADLAEAARVHVHPLRNTATIGLSGGDLLRARGRPNHQGKHQQHPNDFRAF